MSTLQSRLDAEFLLAHMCSVKFKEWIVVLATLLRRSEVEFMSFNVNSGIYVLCVLCWHQCNCFMYFYLLSLSHLQAISQNVKKFNLSDRMDNPNLHFGLRIILKFFDEL